MSLIVACAAIVVIQRGEVRFSRRLSVVMLAAGLLTLPLLWSSWQTEVLSRLLALWGGVGLLCALHQLRLNGRIRNYLLMMIWGIAVLQALLDIVQLLKPELSHTWMTFISSQTGVRPFGIFQQVNLLGSFLATGIGIAGVELLRPTRTQAPLFDGETIHKNITPRIAELSLPSNTPISRRFVYIMGSSLILLWSALLWTQNRTGMLGGLLMLGVLCIWGFRAKRTLGWLIWPSVAGMVIGMLLPYTEIWPTEQAFKLLQASTSQGRLNLLMSRLHLIVKNPLAAWKLSGFSVNWPGGGASALLGIFLFAGIALWPVKKRSVGNSVLPCSPPINMLLVPVILHLMTDFPLYQSTLDLFTLILLMYLSWPATSSFMWLPGKRRVRYMITIAVLPIGICSLSLFIVILSSLITHDAFNWWERGNFRNIYSSSAIVLQPDWLRITQQDRLDYDNHMAMLLAYHTTQDIRYLQAFTRWGENYIARFSDANISAALIQIARLQGRISDAVRITESARLSFPNDARFTNDQPENMKRKYK